MKKLVLTILAAGLCGGAFAQTEIAYVDTNDNAANSVAVTSTNAVSDFQQTPPAQRTADMRRSDAALRGNPYVTRNAMALGADILYGSEIESVGLGFKFQWMISNSFRLNPNFSIWFKNNDLNSFDFNVDLNYLIRLGDRWRLYPIAGLTLSYWHRDANSSKGYDKYSDTNFGVNLGAGIECDITQRWYVDLEVKYRIISDYDQAVFGLGFGYRF